nr:hypothetical protein [Actinomycetota bacterium]
RPARWLRSQLPMLVAGLLAGGAVLAAFAVHQASSAWLTLAGLAAAVAAYLLALPSRRRLEPGAGPADIVPVPMEARPAGQFNGEPTAPGTSA